MYIKCYDRLRVFGGQISAQKLDEQADELKKLRKENEELSKRDNRLTRVEDQISELVRELRKMKGA